MKRLILLSTLVFLGIQPGISQITISSADMPQAGDTLRVSTSNDSIGLPSSALTGAGITWDYSRLVPLTQTIDTFLSVSSTPLPYQFFFNDGVLYPAYKATVAQNGPNFPPLGPLTITQVVNYYKAQSSNYESVGYGATIDILPTSVKDDTIDVVYNFPLNFGNADSCHSSNHTSIPGVGYYGQFQYRVNHVEGWGTLITPYGTFQALKVKTLLFTSDSLYIDTLHFGIKTPLISQIQYKWLANGQHIPVLQINETPGVPIPQYIYRDSIRTGLLGVSELNNTNAGMKVYPNPSACQFNFVIASSAASVTWQSQPILEIYNTMGQEIYTATLKQVQGDNIINLSSQPNGVYFYRVIATDGSLIGEGKLVIEK